MLVLSATVLSVLPGVAQRPAHYEQRNADLANAMDLFAKAKYGAAQFELDRVTDRIADHNDPTRNEAEFMSALCAVRLFHDDARRDTNIPMLRNLPERDPRDISGGSRDGEAHVARHQRRRVHHLVPRHFERRRQAIELARETEQRRIALAAHGADDCANAPLEHAVLGLAAGERAVQRTGVSGVDNAHG